MSVIAAAAARVSGFDARNELICRIGNHVGACAYVTIGPPTRNVLAAFS
jgi:hypothetical protein